VEIKPRGGAMQPIKADAAVEAVLKLLGESKPRSRSA